MPAPHQLRLIAVAAIALLVSGCRAPGYDPGPTVRVSLAGAQIPVELVDSWLGSANQVRFVTEQVSPVYLSQHGFEALRDGECDIACTDRIISLREYEQAGAAGVVGYRIAFYGYALYVHPDNPTDSIYAGHIKSLFQQTMTDWKEIGPFEGPVRLIGLRKNSRGGMILMRQARIWFDEPTWEPMESDIDVVRAVAADPLALGFASIGFDREARYLGLRMERHNAPAFPSIEEIESDKYGLAKVIYIYTTAQPSANSEAVLDYLFSDGGRQAMESTNVWPIPRERSAVPLPH